MNVMLRWRDTIYYALEAVIPFLVKVQEVFVSIAHQIQWGRDILLTTYDAATTLLFPL